MCQYATKGLFESLNTGTPPSVLRAREQGIFPVFFIRQASHVASSLLRQVEQLVR